MKWLLVLPGLILSFSEIGAQGTWYYPGPRGKSVIPYTGCFTDAQTGFAVKNPNRIDTADAIQKTTDGGAIWLPLSSGPFIPLRSIHFPKYSLGYALAANGTTLLKTNDAGANWTRWDVDQRLDNIQFLSDTIGYAMPDKGGFLKTRDGGKTWTEISLQGVRPDRFFFGTEKLGFIVPRTTGVDPESTLAKTKDGGATWEWITRAPKIEAMDFLTPEIGFATGTLTVPGTGTNPLPQSFIGLYKTIDGGSTWKLLLGNQVEVSAPYWSYQEPNMVTTTLGYVIANRKTGSGPTLGSRILKTLNGGTTWSIDYETSELNLFSLSFPEANTGYAKGLALVGDPALDNAILIKYSITYSVSIMPKQAQSLPILRIENGLPVFGDRATMNALGRFQYRN